MENEIVEIRASFWIFFHDGEREHNLGTIEIYPTLTFKEFQLQICQGIGLRLNPNQILIYLVRSGSFPDYELDSIPITEKVNFEFIVGQKDTSYFLVNLKKPKRFYSASLDYCCNHILQSPPCYYQPDDLSSGYQIYDYPLPTFNPYAADMDDLLQDRIMQMELAMVAAATEPIGIRVSDPDWGPSFILNNDLNYVRREKIEDKAKAFCKECAKAEKDEVGIGSFHCCVNDQVIVGFKTSAGPIAPPIKASALAIVPYEPPKP